MKRTISLVILMCMMLHMAVRLDVLSFLYKERHVIAYNVGLITEIPIALCSGDYDFDHNIKIQDADNEENLPVSFPPVREITFFLSDSNLTIPMRNEVLQEPSATLLIEPCYQQPDISIFHPPCEA